MVLSDDSQAQDMAVESHKIQSNIENQTSLPEESVKADCSAEPAAIQKQIIISEVEESKRNLLEKIEEKKDAKLTIELISMKETAKEGKELKD